MKVYTEDTSSLVIILAKWSLNELPILILVCVIDPSEYYKRLILYLDFSLDFTYAFPHCLFVRL